MNSLSKDNSQSILQAIITGLPHSGTTYISRIINNHPDVDSSFECGILLAEKPSEYKNVPNYKFMVGSPKVGHWGISEKNMGKVLAAGNWEEMYLKIRKYSEAIENKKVKLIDKTPQYMKVLSIILGKVSCPCVVIQKEITYLFTSYKKRGVSLERFTDEFYSNYQTGLHHALAEYPDRILLVSFEEIIQDKIIFEKIMEFIGLEYDPVLVQLDQKSKYMNPIRKDYDFEEDRKTSLSILDQNEISLLKRLDNKIKNRYPQNFIF